MRGSFVILAAAFGGMILGAGMERVRARPTDPSPALAIACPAEAPDVVGAPRAAERGASRTDAASAAELVEGLGSPGTPPADGGLVPEPGLRTTPRRNRLQRATSAQLDAMVALLREHDGAASDVDEDATADQGIEAGTAAGEVRTEHARAVLQGMREGFAAAMAPTQDHDAPGSGTNDDGRTTR